MTRTIELSDKVGSFNIYDNGGSSENYTDNCDATLNLKAPEGYKLKLTGTVTTEPPGQYSAYDYLEIDNGSTVKKVYSMSSSSSASVGTITTTNRNMTLKFHSDGSNVGAGLDLTVALDGDPHTVSVSSASNGSVTPSSSSVKPFSTVTLTANPNTGYVLKSVSVKTSSGETISATGGWDTNNKITFTMPNSNVTVTPVFAKDKYAITNVPVEGGTITVVDSAKMGSTVTITAKSASGYMLKEVVVKDANNNIIKLVKNKFTSFSFTMPLFSDVTVTPIWTQDLSAEGGLYIDMPTTETVNVTIPSGVKSFKLYDDGGVSKNYSNDCSGTLILEAPSGYALQLEGSISTYNNNDYFSAYDGSAMSIKLLDKVTSINGKVLSLGRYMRLNFHSDGSNNSSGLNLKVTLIKYDLELQDDGNGGKYVNMLTKNTATLKIPDGVTSFNIYDDGGKDGNYSNNSNGSLILKAPNGYALQIEGSISTYNSNDYFSIYDGTTTSIKLLEKATSINGKILSLGENMRLCFYSDDSNNSSGLNLKVTLIKYNLELQDDGNGGKYVNMLTKNTATLKIPDGVTSFNVYDDGGKDGKYSNNSNGSLEFSAPDGYILQLEGSIATNDANDYLTVKGDDGRILLDKGRSLNEKLYAPSMNLTFLSDASGNGSGLNLTVTVIPERTVTLNAATGGTLRIPSNVIIPGTTVTLTATMDNEFFLESVDIIDDDENKINYNLDYPWYSSTSSATITFKMPNSNVSVTPLFTKNLTDYAMSVNVPASGIKTVTIPTGVQSFKIYDDGGKDGYYSDNSDGTLVLNAPSGYVIELTGSIKTYAVTHTTETCVSGELWDGFYECYQHAYSTTYTCNIEDNLSVYDGSSTSTTSLFTGMYGCNSSNGPSWTSIGKVVSSGNKMTLNFKSGSSGTNAGLDLAVVLRKVSMELEDDGNGGKYVNMVAQQTLNIPKEVKSFKIYDYGGKDGVYVNNRNSTLVLNAPSGYVIELTGSIKTYAVTHTTETCVSGELWDGFYECYQHAYSTTYTCNIEDNLSVYDGSSTSTTALFTGKYGCNSTNGASWTSIGKVTSSGNKMTLNFKSDASGTDAGLDLTVTLRKLAMELEDDGNGGKYVNMLMVRGASLSIPKEVKSFKIYDDGGKNGYYSNNNNGVLELTAPSGYHIELTGTIKTSSETHTTETCISGELWDGFFKCNDVSYSITYSCETDDNLSVYDGSSTSTTPLLTGKNGCNSSNGASWTSLDKVTSSGDKMTLNFKSDASGSSDGLDLTVTLVPVYYTIAVNSASNGSVESDKSKSYVDSVVTLTAKPNSGYMLSDISLSGGANSTIKVSGGWYTNNKATFIMPAYNVTVRPYFTDDIEDGLFINMPKGKTLATIPQGVEYFRIYDNGGSGNYSANSSDTLIIKAPDGYHMFLRGNVTLYRGYDSLYVYDGDNTNANLMYKGSSSAINKETDIGGMLSHSEYMTLYFKSTGDYQFAGLNLNVTVLPAYKINVPASVEGGTVSCNATAAVSGQTITVTAMPDKGYKLAGVVVVDAAGNSIEVKTSLTGNLTFSMPNSDVSVTAEFITMHDVNVVSNYGGTLESDKDKAYPGDVVTLTATPNEGYMLNGFVIKDASGNDVPFRGGDFIDKQGSFTMPAGNVTVTPVFTNKPIDLFVTIPATGTKTVVLPDGMNTFWVYDDGSSTGILSHSYNANGSLVLIAPENSRIYARIRKFGFNSPAALEVFDGASTEATSFGVSEAGQRDTSTGNTMTFNITTYEPQTGIVGIVVELLATRNINVVSADGGTATSDKTTADWQETVTVTANPDDGLLFKGVKVTDKFGDVLGVRGYQTGVNEIWTNNNVANFPKEVSFRMPNSDINIEPKFGEELEASDSLFLKIPETGSKTVTIPSRVASFNVYDNGGRDGMFSTNADGNLVLTAPEGYRFQVSGSINADSKNIANLCVYEGGAVSDDKALVCGTNSVAAVEGYGYEVFVGEIGTTVSEGNTITLRFWTTSSWKTGEGIELVVKVLKPHYGAVTIVRNDDGTSKAVLDGDYNGSEAINIATPIAVDEIDFQRAFSARTPSTALLPFTLPEGSTTNAEFYQLTEVKQVNRSWKARFDYIGDGTLPQANTPYALILPAGQTKLEFNLNNKQAVLQTNNINTVKVSNDDWLFVGVYSYKVWEPGDEELGLAYAFSGKDNSNEGKFGKIKIADDATKLSDYPYANPLRAYLRKKDASVVLKARGSSVATPVASFSLDNLPETIDAEFVKETANGEKTTFVGRMNTRTGEFRMLRDYDVKGRNVGNKANRSRGAYYGKKVIKK
ncbi:MAG: hypothetical protein IKS96_08135 [Fibrobacter sp.]|nr:hypothetical protein [Fibrobacter sp.]